LKIKTLLLSCFVLTTLGAFSQEPDPEPTPNVNPNALFNGGGGGDEIELGTLVIDRPCCYLPFSGENEFYDIAPMSDGNFLLAGIKVLYGPGFTEIAREGKKPVFSTVLVKVNSKADTLWVKTLDTLGSLSIIKTICVLDDNTYILGGKSRVGSISMQILANVDSTGNIRWLKHKLEEGEIHKITKTSDGGFVVAGEYKGKVMVAKRDRNLLLAEVRDYTISGPRNPVVVCFTSPLSSLTVI
jgi:hypothetical protein